MTHLLNNFYAVQIPEGAHKFKVNNEYGVLWYELPPMRGFLSIELEPGSWSIISTSEEIKLLDIINIVERENDGSDNPRSWWYKDYSGSNIWIKDPVESFQSLLKSKFLEGRQLILKLDDGGNKS